MASSKMPLYHECTVAIDSLQNVFRGDTSSAKKKWEEYGKKSFFGSSFVSAYHAIRGDWEKAEELGRNSGKALGEALKDSFSGSKLPVMHELSCCGESLRLVAEDNPEAANAVWTQTYVEDSVLGCAFKAACKLAQGRKEDAVQNCMRSLAALREEEGLERLEIALEGLERLACLCDTLGLIPASKVGGLLFGISLARQIRGLIPDSPPAPMFDSPARAGSRFRSSSI